MKTSQAGIALIKHYEGLSLKPYLCPAKVATIGYGSTFYPDGRTVTTADAPITEAQADTLLRSTLGKFELGVERLVTVPMTQRQFDALVSFVFNLGLGALAGSTLLKKLNAGDYAGSANEFGKWVKAANMVLPGLVKRREAERTLFAS